MGKNGATMNVLQFVGIMLFLCDDKIKNIFVVKCMLRCFELASGIKVNFIIALFGWGSGFDRKVHEKLGCLDEGMDGEKKRDFGGRFVSDVMVIIYISIFLIDKNGRLQICPSD